MKELIDKAAVVTAVKTIYNEDYKFLPSDLVESVQDFKDDLLIALDTLEVKDVNDAYKQGYNDAIDKFCEFMQNCEGYVVSGTKCNYDNFIKYMEQ